ERERESFEGEEEEGRQWWSALEWTRRAEKSSLPWRQCRRRPRPVSSSPCCGGSASACKDSGGQPPALFSLAKDSGAMLAVYEGFCDLQQAPFPHLKIQSLCSKPDLHRSRRFPRLIDLKLNFLQAFHRP
ncbi:unnamed protein product, partial [Musa hybrid cultivar]